MNYLFICMMRPVHSFIYYLFSLGTITLALTEPKTLCCQVEAPRRSPERTHITNFMRANSPEPVRRLSPVARRSPLAAPPPPPVARRLTPPSPTDRPHSEPPKRKAYARDEVSLSCMFGLGWTILSLLEQKLYCLTFNLLNIYFEWFYNFSFLTLTTLSLKLQPL